MSHVHNIVSLNFPSSDSDIIRFGDLMNTKVLVLNANFEPINVTSIHRAINLMFCEKATLILNGRGVIKTINKEFPIPSVIRLKNQISRPRPQVHLTNREVFRRDNYTCQYCGKSEVQLTIDHVIPKHLGGKHVWENVVTACQHCNHRKGGKTPEIANMFPIQPPSMPPASARFLFGKYLPVNKTWETFIDKW